MPSENKRGGLNCKKQEQYRKALDRTRAVSPQSTLAAVVEGRNGGIKERKFQG